MQNSRLLVASLVSRWKRKSQNREGALCRSIAACTLLGLLLTSCAADRTFRPVAPGEGANVPRYVELRDAPQIATFHFPRGVYTLGAVDDAGYYYRAPRRVIKHAFSGFDPYDGGLFVRKDNQSKIRGYVVWAGGRTKIGNLSRANYEFRDSPSTATRPAERPSEPVPEEEY